MDVELIINLNKEYRTQKITKTKKIIKMITTKTKR